MFPQPKSHSPRMDARRWRRVLLVLLLVLPGAAQALSVTPLKIELAAGERAAALTVRNGGKTEQIVQVTPMAWTQANGESNYVPTEALLATPRLFRLSPGGSQLVRVGFLDAPETVIQESAYRLYFEEVPEQNVSGGQLQVLLRLGIPVFTIPDQPQDQLRWSLSPQGDRPQLDVFNLGNRHVRIDNWQLIDADGRVVLEHRDRAYLLAGQRQHWGLNAQRLTLQGISDLTGLRLRAETGRGVLLQDFDADPGAP